MNIVIGLLKLILKDRLPLLVVVVLTIYHPLRCVVFMYAA